MSAPVASDFANVVVSSFASVHCSTFFCCEAANAVPSVFTMPLI